MNRVVEELEHPQGATVVDVVQEPPVASRQISGFENVEVGGKLDKPVVISGGVFQIHDHRIRIGVWVDRESDFACDSLVLAGIAERLAVSEGFAVADFESDFRFHQNSSMYVVGSSE